MLRLSNRLKIFTRHAARGASGDKPAFPAQGHWGGQFKAEQEAENMRFWKGIENGDDYGYIMGYDKPKVSFISTTSGLVDRTSGFMTIVIYPEDDF